MAGRPEYEFTDEQIAKAEELAFKGCQNGTIATLIGCDNETVKKYLSQRLSKKRAERKVWLREIQIKLAGSNVAMAIFLGKNELDQSDKQEITHGVTDDFADLLTKICGKDDLRPESDEE